MARPRKTQINLSESLQRRLNSYALAASAAGVGTLTLTQPAQAKIIYTKTHEVIGLYGLHSYALDLNHDGIVDVTFKWGRSSGRRERLFVSGESAPDQVLGTTSRNRYIYALKPGARIGPIGHFVGNGTMAGGRGSVNSNYSGYGPWRSVQNGYLGLKFVIMVNGATTLHYGWARLSVKAQASGITAILTGYAYETIPNKPIIAGKTHGTDDAEQPVPASLTIPAEKPATLGVLALGARGLSILKREGSPEAERPVLGTR